jgi:hypothetical protein
VVAQREIAVATSSRAAADGRGGVPRTCRWLVIVAVGTVAVAAVLVVWLHTLPDWGGVDPITDMLSSYGIGSRGWVFNDALDLVAAGSAVLLVAMARCGVVRRRTETALMAGWCVFLVGVATFHKDAAGAAPTLEGAVHVAVTAAACVSLPCAAVVICYRRADLRWRRYHRITRAVALWSVPCLLPFLVSFFATRLISGTGFWTVVPTGLVERGMAVLDLATLVVLALWTWSVSSAGRP